MLISNLIISLEAVLPMFLLIALGFYARRKNFLDGTDVVKMNKVVFSFMFPAMMFNNLYGEEIGEAFDIKLIVYALVAISIIYALTVIFALKVEKSQRSRGAMIHAIFRSNFVIMGLSIVSNIFGDDNLALASVMITIVVPYFNVLAVITLEVFRGGKPSLGHVLMEIAKNPLIKGAVLGMIAVLLSLKLPFFLERTVDMIGGCATPMALLMLGASFDLQSIERCKRNLIICVTGKLVAVPALGLGAAVALGFRGVPLLILLAVFASPTSVSSFTMAQQMDSDDELAGNCVIFTSIISCFTMFLWIFFFKTFGLF